MNRERLVEIPAGTELLREVRYMPDEAFAEVSTEELEAAARWLRAASYSAAEGARRIDRIISHRSSFNSEGSPCTSHPNSTEPSTTTEGHRPAEAPDPAP